MCNPYNGNKNIDGSILFSINSVNNFSNSLDN